MTRWQRLTLKALWGYAALLLALSLFTAGQRVQPDVSCLRKRRVSMAWHCVYSTGKWHCAGLAWMGKASFDICEGGR